MPDSTWDAINDAALTTANSPVRINVLTNDFLGSTGSTGNIITVRVSGDQYKGSSADPYPRFNLLLDGQKIGETGVVTANYKLGQWQEFTFKADTLATSKGVIGIQFINDAHVPWVGDRNLHVDSVSVNGKAFEPSIEHVYYNTVSTVNVGSQLASLLKQPATTSTVSIAGGPANGTAVVNADKTITYTPKAGFSGADNFSYKLTNSAGLSDTADVGVTIGSGGGTGAGHYKTQHYTVKTDGQSESYGGRKFFIDPASGASGNNGTTEGSAWKSFADAERFANSSGFKAGDAVFFKRGHTYDTKAGFNIKGEGTADKPVVFGAYGNGEPPKLVNSNYTPDARGTDTSIWDTVLNVDQQASYIKITDLYIGNARAGNTFEAGIRVRGDHITIDNVEITKAGQGVVFGGTLTGSSNSVVENSFIHDLTMVRNTNDGTPPGRDDDYGAIGVHVAGASDVTVRDNTFKNLKQPSYDYKVDGSVMEISETVRNVSLEGNYIENALCVTELGGQSHNTHANISIDHNVIVNTDGIGYFHNGVIGSISNVDFTNNTVHSTLPNSPDNYSSVFGFRGSNGSFLEVKNNIFEIAALDRFDVGATNYTHSNNLYDTGAVPFTSGFFTSNEYKGDPAFANAGARDFHLTAGSAALSKAVPIAAHLTDYAEVNLVGRPNLDIGAVEFMG